ncbi:MAG: hypothetical protein JKY65_18255 [Planctomycetes bacterium]|nr:hypothetical protein [Planctomycetota bacterium]
MGALTNLRKRFTRRHLAVAIVLFTVSANVYVDYRLFLRNPRELEAQAKRFVRAALPGYSAQFGPKTEFNFFTGTLTLSDVKIHRQGSTKPEDVLFEVPTLKVESDGLIPTRLSITAIHPTANLTITREGKIKGFAFESTEDEEPVTSLPLDLDIKIEGGVLRLRNDFEGIGATILVSELRTLPDRRIRILKDLSCEGALSLSIGSVVPKTGLSPKQVIKGLGWNEEFKAVLPDLTVELSQTAGGPLSVVAHGKAVVSRAIRGLIPPTFQTEVWDVINPLRGEADLVARITKAQEQISIDLSLTPHAVAMKAKGFPVELVDIEGGRFEISIAVAEGNLRFLGVSWEEVHAKISGAKPGDPGLGLLISRGTVYPGRETENVILQITVQAYDLPLAPHLVNAIPPKIRAVYDLFDPQGTVPEAHIMISKGPEQRDTLVLSDGRKIRGLIDPDAVLEVNAMGDMIPSAEQPRSKGLDAAIRFVDFQQREWIEAVRDVVKIDQNSEPQIAVWVPRLDGRLSASFRDVPERLENIQGWFELREGGNVQVHCEGTLEHGGTAKVLAQVMAGDLISVHVTAKNVPIGQGLIDAMPGNSKAMIEPFRLKGGEIDLDVRVSKPHLDAPIVPVIKVKLRKVGFDHLEASIPLVATGTLEVRPQFATDEQEAPDRIDIALDLALEGEGVIAALASGTLSLPPTQPKDGLEFDANLNATIGELKVEVLPALIRDLLKTVRPSGLARQVEVHIESPQALWVKGVGAGLEVRPKAFDVPLRVERFHVEVAVDRVLLHDAVARRVLGGKPQGGSLQVTGWIDLGGAEPPPLELNVTLERVPLERTLVEVLPEGTRDALRVLSPSGELSGSLKIRLDPSRPADVRGELRATKGRITLHRIHERMSQLKSAPVTDLEGRIGIAPERITFRDMSATTAKARLTLAAGEIRLADGEITGFDMPVELRGLVINQRTRALAGEAAQEFFKTFYVEGPTELSLRTFQASPNDTVHVHIEARPRGALVRADFAAVPVSGLTGTARIEDGEPVKIDLTGFLSPPRVQGGTAPADPDAARIRIRREAGREKRFPGRGKAGQVYRVSITHFQRYPLVKGPDRPTSLRERFEARLPATWRETLDQFDLAGTFDVEAWIYQPTDPRDAMRWVTETRFRDAAMTLTRFDDAPPPRPGERADGIGFTDMSGVIRLKGRFAELEQGSCAGELYLSRADFFKQSFRDLRGPFQIQGGKLSLGVPGKPFRARLYEGDFLGRADYDFQDGAYACEFALGLGRDVRLGRLATMMRELDRLSDEPPKEGKIPFAFRGRLSAKISCGGGGTDLAGRPRPFSGAGQLRLEDSNLLDTAFLKALQVVVATIRGSDSQEPLPNLALDFRMNETGLRIKSADLWGRDMKVHGEDGIFRYDGYIDIDVVPFDTSGGLHQFLKWIPGAGYNYRGSFTSEEGPKITAYLNPLSTIDWFRDLWQSDDE